VRTKNLSWIPIAALVLGIGVVIIIAVTLPSLSTTLGPILGAVIGLGGILYSQHLTNVRDEGQRASDAKLKDKELAHVENMKDKDLEEARQTRLRDDRIKAYTEFLRLTIGRYTDDASVTTELVGTYSSILLFAGNSEAIEAAKDLYTKVIDLRNLAHEVTWEEERTAEGQRIRKSTFDPRYNLAQKAVGEATMTFIKAAKVDIGHSSDVTEPPSLRPKEYGD
jgi:hypothetical protein